jgi:hypothetical protein
METRKALGFLTNSGNTEVGRSEAGYLRIADYLPETRRKELTENLAERLGLFSFN